MIDTFRACGPGRSLKRSALLVLVVLLGTHGGAESLWQDPEPSGFSVWTSFNPDFPLGGNDGPLWQGRGTNVHVSGGAAVEWEGWSVSFFPELDLSQNLPYRMIGGPGDYGSGLDRVQRYGESPVLHLNWGSSELRYRWPALTVGAGTKPLVLGTATRNHIVLSNNAGGFPHLEVGTPGPLDTPWGAFEGRVLWGGLYDSAAYEFNSGTSEDWRFFHALMLGYSPPFWPEVTVGAVRVFYSPLETLTVFKVFESVVDTLWKSDRGRWSGKNGVQDDVDQLAALYLDLSYPREGFRVYGELARNDHASGLNDFLRQPDHSLGYVMGVRKEFSLATGTWDVRYEQADLGLNYGTLVRPTGSWYRHFRNLDGYTLGGQVLGAAIGPGSNSNFLELGTTWGTERLFFSLERVANDVDYWVKVVQPPDTKSADIALLGTLGGSSVRQDWTLSWALTWWQNFNRHWEQTWDPQSWKLELGLSQALGRR